MGTRNMVEYCMRQDGMFQRTAGLYKKVFWLLGCHGVDEREKPRTE
jgi:hypothetical protein